LKGIQKNIKFQWISSHYGIMDSEMAHYLANKGTAMNPTFPRKLSFHSAKLKIKSIQADLTK
jgi:hypothetical protein